MERNAARWVHPRNVAASDVDGGENGSDVLVDQDVFCCHGVCQNFCVPFGTHQANQQRDCKTCKACRGTAQDVLMFLQLFGILAAVHRPLHAVRNAPTTTPTLHELAALHRPSMRERTWCQLTTPMAQSERLQMAVAMSKILPLSRINAATPYYDHVPLALRAAHTRIPRDLHPLASSIHLCVRPNIDVGRAASMCCSRCSRSSSFSHDVRAALLV